MTRAAIAGLILSGGESRRMGTPKALLVIEGQTFIDRLIDMLAGVCSPVIAVLGHGAPRIQSAMRRGAQVEVVVNPDPRRGMLSSLQCGLSALAPEIEAVIFTPVDYPQIDPRTVERLADAFQTSRAPVTIPVHQGERGHPVCIARSVADQLLALPPEAQARDVIRAYRPRTRFIQVADAGVISDIDYPADYQALEAEFVRAGGGRK